MFGRALLNSGATAVFFAAMTLSSCRTVPTKPDFTAPAETEKPPSPALAHYIKTVQDRIGAIWYALANKYGDQLHLGTVKISFDIPAAGGKVQNVRVISNTGGRMDKLIALRAIDQFRTPPIPTQVQAELPADHLYFDEMVFTVFPPE
jgi:hypothetical protein